MIVVHAYGEPRPGGSKKAILHSRTRQPILIENEPAKAKAWRKEVALQGRLTMRGRPPLSGPLALGVVFLLPRPKTVSRDLPAVKPDVDKLLRPLDSFTGVVWNDDGQVVVTVARKVYADRLAPGLTAVVLELDELPADAEPIELVAAALRQVLELRGEKTRREHLADELLAGPVDRPVAVGAQRDEVRVDVVAELGAVDQVVPLEPGAGAAQTALALGE